jgi:Family of unknown function (DUF6600)/FecR protein
VSLAGTLHMLRCPRAAATAVGLALLLALPVSAATQNAELAPSPDDAVVAHEAPPSVTLVDGDARLIHEGHEESLTPGLLLVAGDVVATERGRVEIVLADGSLVGLDEDTALEVSSGTVMRLVAGRLHVILATLGDARHAFRVDTPGAGVLLLREGEYRVALEGKAPVTETDEVTDVTTTVSVMAGSAMLLTDDGSTPLAGGDMVAVRAGTVTEAPRAITARRDAFDAWLDARRADRRSSRSAEYLPGELRPYAPDLDDAGAWHADTTYGYIWYPTVSYDWRPYYHGSWHHYPRYGWTWIDARPWGWATHHYGRWGHDHRGWFWIPSRRWGPAWVSWVTAPSYVGWCPLGWDGRPVVAFGWNVDRGFASSRHRIAPWTIIPRQRFGERRSVHSFALGSTAIDGERHAFRAYRPGAPPRASGYAVPRTVPRGWQSWTATRTDDSYTRAERQWRRHPRAGEVFARPSASEPSPSRAPRADAPVNPDPPDRPARRYAVPRERPRAQAAPPQPEHLESRPPARDRSRHPERVDSSRPERAESSRPERAESPRQESGGPRRAVRRHP